MTFAENEMVTDVILSTQNTDAGTDTISVGTDENWENAAEDTDALIAAHSLTGASISRMTLLDEASQTDAAFGIAVTNSAGGDVVIQASSDQTTNEFFSGQLIVEYITVE
jgi:hypothetical protein